jgi:hypothetical protein
MRFTSSRIPAFRFVFVSSLQGKSETLLLR